MKKVFEYMNAFTCLCDNSFIPEEARLIQIFIFQHTVGILNRGSLSSGTLISFLGHLIVITTKHEVSNRAITQNELVVFGRKDFSPSGQRVGVRNYYKSNNHDLLFLEIDDTPETIEFWGTVPYEYKPMPPCEEEPIYVAGNPANLVEATDAIIRIVIKTLFAKYKENGRIQLHFPKDFVIENRKMIVSDLLPEGMSGGGVWAKVIDEEIWTPTLHLVGVQSTRDSPVQIFPSSPRRHNEFLGIEFCDVYSEVLKATYKFKNMELPEHMRDPEIAI